MLFSRLLAALPDAVALNDRDAEVTAVTHDSREVRPGKVFVAVPGFTVDGHDYIADALAASAGAVVVQKDEEQAWRPVLAGSQTPFAAVPDTRAALPVIAALVAGRPARKLNVIGVTGTDGKTSLCHLLAHLLAATGEKAGLISTAECRIGDERLPDTGRFTTPEAPEVQSMLTSMVDAGCRWAVVEATSHGLTLHRVDECEYDIAVFTNLGRDHMDFHGTPEDYMAAKGRLFQMLDNAEPKSLEKVAVLNADDPAQRYFSGLTSARKLTYGLGPDAMVRAEALAEDGWKVSFTLGAGSETYSVTVPQPGEFSVYNSLAAVATLSAAGIELSRVIPALATWHGAPGRLQLVDAGQGFRVVVDFAHAADSLRRVLQLLRRTSRGRLIAVFGCIGERDRDRREGMARAAAELADYTIVTDDNPYTEDRFAILDAIAAGLRAAGRKEGHDFAIVPDRREAIAQAVAMAVDDDSVLLAGKGHEAEVHLADGKYECDDFEVSRRVLAELGYEPA